MQRPGYVDAMTASDHVRPADRGWDLEQLIRLRESNDLVLIPEWLEQRFDGSVTAVFSAEAHQLRAIALDQGLSVGLAIPEGAESTILEEYSADAVLPYMLDSVAVPLVVGLVTNFISQHLGKGRSDRVKLRLVSVNGDRAEIREIEGTREDVETILRQIGPDETPPPAA